MRKHVLTVAATLLAATVGMPAAVAAIYKSVDENGNTVFSSTPPDGDAEEVTLPPINTLPPQPVVPASGTNKKQVDDEAAIYTLLTIRTPEHDSSVRDNAGNISITVGISPALMAARGDQLLITLDGTVVSRGKQATIQLKNVDRGTHSVGARVIDANGKTLITAQPAVFHLQRISALN